MSKTIYPTCPFEYDRKPAGDYTLRFIQHGRDTRTTRAYIVHNDLCVREATKRERELAQAVVVAQAEFENEMRRTGNYSRYVQNCAGDKS